MRCHDGRGKERKDETDNSLHPARTAECRQAGVVRPRDIQEEVSLHKKMRLAIAVNDDYIEKTIDAIIEGARTGDIGDGKIFVLPMDECVRIRTGERGSLAIG